MTFYRTGPMPRIAELLCAGESAVEKAARYGTYAATTAGALGVCAVGAHHLLEKKWPHDSTEIQAIRPLSPNDSTACLVVPGFGYKSGEDLARLITEEDTFVSYMKYANAGISADEFAPAASEYFRRTKAMKTHKMVMHSLGTPTGINLLLGGMIARDEDVPVIDEVSIIAGPRSVADLYQEEALRTLVQYVPEKPGLLPGLGIKWLGRLAHALTDDRYGLKRPLGAFAYATREAFDGCAPSLMASQLHLLPNIEKQEALRGPDNIDFSRVFKPGVTDVNIYVAGHDDVVKEGTGWRTFFEGYGISPRTIYLEEADHYNSVQQAMERREGVQRRFEALADDTFIPDILSAPQDPS